MPKIKIEAVSQQEKEDTSLAAAFQQAILAFQETFMKTSVSNLLRLSAFHHKDNDEMNPIDECELQIKIPLLMADFKNGIFDIASKVVR